MSARDDYPELANWDVHRNDRWEGARRALDEIDRLRWEIDRNRGAVVPLCPHCTACDPHCDTMRQVEQRGHDRRDR